MCVDGCSDNGGISRRWIESDHSKNERKGNGDDGAVQSDASAPVPDATESKFPKHNFIVLYSCSVYRVISVSDLMNRRFISVASNEKGSRSESAMITSPPDWAGHAGGT